MSSINIKIKDHTKKVIELSIKFDTEISIQTGFIKKIIDELVVVVNSNSKRNLELTEPPDTRYTSWRWLAEESEREVEEWERDSKESETEGE